MYMIKHMPKGPCWEVKEAIKRSSGGENTVSLEKLRSEIEKMLPETLLKDNLPAFVEAFRSQLKFANRTQTFGDVGMHVYNSLKLDTSVAKLLNVLNMAKYYPQKLTYDDVIQLGNDVYNDVDKKPTSVPELPWYFMKHMIGLDSDTRWILCACFRVRVQKLFLSSEN